MTRLLMTKLHFLPLCFLLIAATLSIAAQSTGEDQAIRTFFVNADVS